MIMYPWYIMMMHQVDWLCVIVSIRKFRFRGTYGPSWAALYHGWWAPTMAHLRTHIIIPCPGGCRGPGRTARYWGALTMGRLRSPPLVWLAPNRHEPKWLFVRSVNTYRGIQHLLIICNLGFMNKANHGSPHILFHTNNPCFYHNTTGEHPDISQHEHPKLHLTKYIWSTITTCIYNVCVSPTI